ncbi:MAG: diguanylate cyclase [Pseudomonadota bacterium]
MSLYPFRSRFLFWCLLVTSLLSSVPVAALETVSLQLNGTHSFEFAGYYAAKEHGYYREAGLDVDFLEATADTDVVKRVITNSAQFGVGDSSLLLARAADQPVLVLAVIFQHSPLVVVAKKQQGGQSLHDLAGKKVLIAKQADELRAYFKQEGLFPEKLEAQPQSVNPRDLLKNKVDAISASSTQDLFYLDRARFSYQVYTPRSAGIDFYGDNLFTTELEAKNHGQRLEAFRDASLRGWSYAIQHPDEIAALISTSYSKTHSLDFYLFQAREMVSLIRQDQIEIGNSKSGRWQHIAEVYADLGLLARDANIEGLLYNSHRFQFNLKWLNIWRMITMAVMLVVLVIILYIFRINRRLARSIMENRTTAAELADRERLWRTIINTSPDGITIASLDGIILQVSSRVSAMFGYDSVDEIIGRNIFDFFDPAWHARANIMIGELVKGTHAGAVEFLMIRKDGGTFFIEINAEILRDDNGNPRALFFIERDITERKQAEELLDEYNQKLAALSITDGLTGIANRRHFDETLVQEYSRCARSGVKLSLILLDIDYFKAFNDTYGHIKGDECLRQIGKVIAGCAHRATDLAARYGGEEFACILPETDLNGAVSMAENIRQSIYALAIPHQGSKVADSVTASLGVLTVNCTVRQSIEDILSLVDAMLYRAKSSGRNRVEVDGD